MRWLSFPRPLRGPQIHQDQDQDQAPLELRGGWKDEGLGTTEDQQAKSNHRFILCGSGRQENTIINPSEDFGPSLIQD